MKGWWAPGTAPRLAKSRPCEMEADGAPVERRRRRRRRSNTNDAAAAHPAGAYQKRRPSQFQRQATSKDQQQGDEALAAQQQQALAAQQQQRVRELETLGEYKSRRVQALQAELRENQQQLAQVVARNAALEEQVAALLETLAASETGPRANPPPARVMLAAPQIA